jgi:hypothetical protein
MIVEPVWVTDLSLFPKKQQLRRIKLKQLVLEIAAFRDFFVKKFILLLSMVMRFEPRSVLRLRVLNLSLKASAVKRHSPRYQEK